MGLHLLESSTRCRADPSGSSCAWPAMLLPDLHEKPGLPGFRIRVDLAGAFGALAQALTKLCQARRASLSRC